jgi:hypothetical protein
MVGADVGDIDTVCVGAGTAAGEGGFCCPPTIAARRINETGMM